MNELEKLKQRLQELEAQRVAEFEGGSADLSKVDNIMADIKAVQQQISAMEIDERVHADEIPFAVSGVDMSGMPVEVIQFVEEVVKTDRKRIYNEHAIELEQLEEEARENGIKMMELENMLVVANDLSFKRGQKVESLESRHREYELLIEDAQSKRDAAVAELNDVIAQMQAQTKSYSHEVERLTNRIEELEQAAEYAERQDQPITVSPDESTSLQAAADAVKKLFKSVDDWGSILKVTKPDGSIELVKRGELADEWEEVQEATEETFRPEATVEAPELQTTTDGLFEGNASGEVVPETFEEEVRRRLNTLETGYSFMMNRAS